ncbi:hypothetical protein, partial [Micromonospora echinofusca]|nr:hypothetical protein [Micromonospora echinofusca]
SRPWQRPAPSGPGGYPSSAPPHRGTSWAGAGPGIPGTGVGVAALVASFCFGPLGLVIAIVALLRGARQTATDRVCATIALGVGGLWTLVLVCGQIIEKLSGQP